ncbi:MAG: hypothetical protein EOM18_17375, partial [Clostridia bacterium]|nr:hypothetical protein [Clostridia bacterium]
MKLKRIVPVLTAVMILSAPLSAEYIFLKDGSILKGTIVSDTAATVNLRLEDRRMQRIPRSDIMRILYTDLYMGKVYIQKIDGKSIVAYMVDEDRDTYTFRMEIYKP